MTIYGEREKNYIHEDKRVCHSCEYTKRVPFFQTLDWYALSEVLCLAITHSPNKPKKKNNKKQNFTPNSE